MMQRRPALWVSGAAAATGLAAYALALRPWHLRWGATVAEFNEPLPGDELVPKARHHDTHAVTIHAPIRDVWPWIAQIGQDRGGFYSYSWLENLVGCRLRNADRIVPEFQEIHAGDVVWLHPKVPPLPVLIAEPPRTLVLGSNTNVRGTWSFHLKEIDANTTRLLTRGRSAGLPGPLHWLGHHALFEPAHFLMERKMLLGIKARAEGLRGEGVKG